MATYIIRRLAQALVTLFIVSLLVFGVMRLTPGDPARAMLGNEYRVTEEMLNTVRREMGLDQPLHVQYLRWLGGCCRATLGAQLEARLGSPMMSGQRKLPRSSPVSAPSRTEPSNR